MAIDQGTYAHINTNTTTVLNTRQGGILRQVVINTPGATANTATIYDNNAASGTVIAVINTVTTNATSLNYDLQYSNGLTVVTASGTAADLTVVYT